ncbi:hypothetical protein AAC387_Pa02g2372 [Persea americana]
MLGHWLLVYDCNLIPQPYSGQAIPCLQTASLFLKNALYDRLRVCKIRRKWLYSLQISFRYKLTWALLFIHFPEDAEMLKVAGLPLTTGSGDILTPLTSMS